ncbi:MAG: hypothetical protein IKA30_03545 [Alphaproteobacteria bacterium]|nr:hypothetical protein [Alphaproteobacteria bacterium]
MYYTKKVEMIAGLDPSQDYQRQELRKQLWLIAMAIEHKPSEKNQFYASLEYKLQNLRRSVLILEREDKQTKENLLELIDDMLEVMSFDLR